MLQRRSALVFSALVAGCMANEEVLSRTSDIAIEGPWVPSDATRAIAATEHVTVVNAPAVAPLGRCTSTNAFACSCTHPACTPAHPGTRDLKAYLLRRYGFLRDGGTYCCRQNSSMTTVPMLSVHAIGRAMDLMVPMAGGDADNTLGDETANWLVENAEYIGIQRVIWDRAFWNGEHGFGLLPATSRPHTDHLHVELSVAGAARQTPFFTSGASMGTTCTARCDGTRLIRSDCSSVDCAATGAPCLPEAPPRCGSPAPAEPAEARAVPDAVLPTVSPAATPSRFTFVGPHRLFDTRTAEGSARLVRSGAAGPLTATSNGTFRDWSAVGLPPGATGAWLNVTAIGVGGVGFATAFSAGQPRPPTSTVNYIADAANANATPVVLGAGDGVTFEAVSPSHMITDAYGAFSPTGAGLVPAGPFRVLDTRSDVALASDVPRAIDVRAPAGAVGVVASVTAIAGSTGGFLTAYPCGTPTPSTSNLNFSAGSIVTNTVVSTLGGGELCLIANTAAHVIVDVTGFFAPSSGLTYTALSPRRILDTRQAASLFTGRLGARQVLEIPLQRLPGMPSSAVAVVANLTAVTAAESGFVTAFPCGTPVPNTSSLTFPADGAVGALTVATLGAGSLCLFSNVRVHLIVDVLGVWTGASTTPTMPPDPLDNGDDLRAEGSDAGADAGTGTDASSVDGGVAEADVRALVDVGEADSPSIGRPDLRLTGGCGCRAVGTPSSGGALALGAVFAWMRRRRLAGSRASPAQGPVRVTQRSSAYTVRGVFR